jgi:hypothetical protein
MAAGPDGPIAGVSLRLGVDAAGSFEDESQVRCRDVVTGVGGTAYFRWWKWPPGGSWKDITSVITASWMSDDINVWLADLYE